MNIKKFLRTHIPIVMTQEKLSKIIGDTQSRAVFEEKSFSDERKRQPRGISDWQDDFPLYENQLMPVQRMLIKQGTKRNIKLAARTFMEFFTGSLFTNRAIGGFESLKEPTLDQTLLLQDAAMIKAHSDPHGKSIVDNIVNFTIGKGVKVDCVVSDINRILTRFRVQNNFTRRERSMVKTGFINGEYFSQFFLNPKGNKGEGYIRMAMLSSDVITDMEFLKGDTNAQLAFKLEFSNENGKNVIQWLPSIDLDLYQAWDPTLRSNHGDPKSMELLHFVKYGDNDNESRGRVPMQPILRFLKYFEDWIIDRIRLNHERAKVVWIKTNTGQTATPTANPMAAPRGGIILEESGDVRYRIEKSQVDATDAKEDGMAILYSIGAGVVMPIHILDQRADQAVYASIKKSDTPFSQMIEAHQDLWSDAWGEIYKFVIRKNVEWGTLKSTYQVPIYYVDPTKAAALYSKISEMFVDDKSTEEIVKEVEIMKEGDKRIAVATDEIIINQIFPDVVKEDPLTDAKVIQLHRQTGIASLETLASRAGYNWKEEFAKMKAETDMKLGNVGMGVPGGGFGAADDLKKDPNKPDDKAGKKAGEPSKPSAEKK